MEVNEINQLNQSGDRGIQRQISSGMCIFEVNNLERKKWKWPS